MTPTKPCTNCNKTVSIELFEDSEKGECFKTCDACREKARAARERNKKRNPEEEVKETLNDGTTLNVKNRN